MEELRKELNENVERYGLDYNKLIDIDRKIHKEIIRNLKKQMEGLTNV